MLIDRRSLGKGVWCAPVILGVGVVPAYSASPSSSTPSTFPIHHTYSTLAANLTLPNGQEPNRNIHSLAITRRNTLIAGYGDYNANSDSFGKPRTVIQEYEPLTGNPVGESFPVGSEALIHHTKDQEGALYYSTTDPSAKPAQGQTQGEISGIIHDTQGHWEFTPIGGAYAHVLGISITQDGTIFLGTGGWDGKASILQGKLGEHFHPLTQWEGNPWGRVYELWADPTGQELVFRANNLKRLRNGYYRYQVGTKSLQSLNGDIGQVWWNQTGELVTFRTDGQIFNENTHQEIHPPTPRTYYTPHNQNSTTLYTLPSQGHTELLTYNKNTQQLTTHPIAETQNFFSRATLYHNNTLYLGDNKGRVHVYQNLD